MGWTPIVARGGTNRRPRCPSSHAPESPISAPALAPPPLPWVRVALRAGVVAGLLGSAALALGYVSAFPDVPPLGSWSLSVAAILLAGSLSGASLGLAISGGMAVGRRRSGRAVHEVMGAIVGGAVGSILPSAIGVLGFGSLSCPYIGTDIAALGVLVAAVILGTLLSSPRATGRAREVSIGASTLCSALASVLVIIPFGATIAGIVAAALPLATIRQILRILGGALDDSALALGAVALALALVFGAITGAFVGLAGSLAALLRDTWSLTLTSRAPPLAAREAEGDGNFQTGPRRLSRRDHRPLRGAVDRRR